MDFLLWLCAAYIAGAVPWSVWLGKRYAGVDPRSIGDGNPGAANTMLAAGKGLGVAVLVLDFLKGFIPVFAARELPVEQFYWVALAPMIGHSFSVFLRFRGGRGITTSFGVWTGITLYEIPIVMGLTALVSLRLFKNDELRAVCLPLAAMVYLLLAHRPPWMLLLALAQVLILLVKIGAFYRQSWRMAHHVDT